MTDNRQATCEERIDSEMKRTLRTLWKLWEWYKVKMDEYHPTEQTNIYEYGLSFDYVEPGTFNDQPIGYWRYQLSWGGPSDEFRFFDDGYDGARVEYWFLDWFDGAHRILRGEDRSLMLEIFDWLTLEEGFEKEH